MEAVNVSPATIVTREKHQRERGGKTHQQFVWDRSRDLDVLFEGIEGGEAQEKKGAASEPATAMMGTGVPLSYSWIMLVVRQDDGKGGNITVACGRRTALQHSAAHPHLAAGWACSLVLLFKVRFHLVLDIPCCWC